MLLRSRGRPAGTRHFTGRFAGKGTINMTVISAEKNSSHHRPLRAAALDIGSNSCRILIAEAAVQEDSRTFSADKDSTDYSNSPESSEPADRPAHPEAADADGPDSPRRAAFWNPDSRETSAPADSGSREPEAARASGSHKKELKPVYYDLKTTRLAAGIEKSGRLNSESLEKTVAALKDFSRRLQQYQVSPYWMVGTSALREVSDAGRLKAEIKAETGLELKIITGQREAELIYRGASAVLTSSSSGGLVIDIGGGSTEIITKKSGRILPVSLRMGAVRFTERFISDPARPIPGSEITGLKEAAFALIRASRELSPLDKTHTSPVESPAVPGAVGVGGTITSLAAIRQEMASYNPEIIEGYYLSLEEVNFLIDLFASRSLEARQEITGLQPARADIITAGTIILSALLEYFRLSGIKVSEQDILYGILREELNL